MQAELPPDSVSVDIGAPPDKVWELVSDVSNYGVWSPENQDSEWIGDIRKPEPGARFVGRNRVGFLSWSTECEVTQASPGKVFEFEVKILGRTTTRWRYEIAATDTGSVVTESYEVIWSPIRPLYPLMRRARMLRSGMKRTLDGLKLAAEAPDS